MKLVPLYDQSGTVVAHARVDDADYGWLMRWRWCLDGEYAERGSWHDGHQINVRMHRQILGLLPGDGIKTDHRDRDGLNNQRSNLRVVTHAQNMQNKGSYRGSSSRHRGVSLHRRTGRWQAYGKLGGKQVYLGLYDDEDEAAEVAATWRRDHMPYSTEPHRTEPIPERTP